LQDPIAENVRSVLESTQLGAGGLSQAVSVGAYEHELLLHEPLEA